MKSKVLTINVKCLDAATSLNLHFMFVQIGKNPIQNAGCYGILQSMQENPDSAIEALDFSVTCKFIDFTRLSAEDLLFERIQPLPCLHLFPGYHSQPGF